MLKFLHISDLHIRSDHRNGQVARRLAVIRELYPDYRLIVTGDVTANGDEKEYVQAMYTLSSNAYVVPGNHDYGLLGNFYGPERAKRFHEHFRPGKSRWRWPMVNVINTKTEKVVLIGLDSCLRTKHPLDFARGKVGWLQRWRLKRLLRVFKGWVRIVYLHHHPFERGFTLALEDSKKLFPILADCEVALFGHKHKAEQWRGRPWYIAAGAFGDSDYVTKIVVDESVIEINHQVRVVDGDT